MLSLKSGAPLTPRCRRRVTSTVVKACVAVRLVFFACSAYALDCDKASSSVEIAICKNDELKKSEAELSALYFRILRTLVGRSHDYLLEEQRSWAANRQHKCENDNRTGGVDLCVRLAIRDRKTNLGARFADVANAWPDERMSNDTANKLFEGEWGEGDYTLYQSGSRVCGFYVFEASNHVYEGHLVADVIGVRAIVKVICGTPDTHNTDKLCPGPNDKVPSQSEGWESRPSVLFVRNGRLFAPLNCFVEGRGCSPKDPSFGLERRTLTQKDPTRLVDEAWLIKCLSDPGFPAEDAVK